MISRDILFYAFQVELEFRSVCFLIEEKKGVPGEKPLVARKITRPATNYPHTGMLSTLGFEPGPHVGGRRVLSQLCRPTFPPAPVMC